MFTHTDTCQSDAFFCLAPLTIFSKLGQNKPQKSFCVCVDMENNKHLSSKDPTHSNDAENIEDGRTHDRPHSHVSFSDEYTCTERRRDLIICTWSWWCSTAYVFTKVVWCFTYDWGEELRSRTPCCHERGSCYIFTEVEALEEKKRVLKDVGMQNCGGKAIKILPHRSSQERAQSSHHTPVPVRKTYT